MTRGQPRPLTDAEIERALERSRSLEDAPEHVIQRALAVFVPRAAAGPSPLAAALRRIAAVLSFDSGIAPPLAFGRRSAGSSVRQLLYSAEGRDVDLRVVAGKAASTFDLSGQVLGPNTQGRVVLQAEDAASGAVMVEAPIDELGEFNLRAVAPGRWRVLFELADTAIELPPLHVPHDA
jgi:hypothetical protein